MPRWTEAWFGRVAAVLLLAVLVLSVAHAAVPDHKTQRDCSTCKALHAPGLVVEAAGHAAALPPGPAGPCLREEFRPQTRARGLQLLRAPPLFS